MQDPAEEQEELEWWEAGPLPYPKTSFIDSLGPPKIHLYEEPLVTLYRFTCTYYNEYSREDEIRNMNPQEKKPYNFKICHLRKRNTKVGLLQRSSRTPVPGRTYPDGHKYLL